MLILTTARLRLRWFSEADAPFIHRLLNEPSWIRNIGDRQIRSMDDAAAYIRTRLLNNYWRHGFGFWAVERVADGALIGMCGLTQRDSLPEPDVGYALLPAYWGQGYAREAAAACLRYAQQVLGLHTVLAITAPHNQASMALLAAVGLQPGVPPVLAGDDGESRLFAWHAVAEPPLGGLVAEPPLGGLVAEPPLGGLVAEPPLGGLAAAAPPDDLAAIDALVRRFFAAFSAVDGALPTLAALPRWCLPEMRIHRRDVEGAVGMDLHGFIAARAELLDSGRLRDFEEQETAQRTDIAGGLAQRWSHTLKSGRLDGVPFEVKGHRAFQLLRTPRGWRIASLVWEDFA
ncbi:GNAT family N-acetyltransferase [Aquabacterium sp.]|uniref:GNAT family N-acetyltransferase n=1 Tax=Aquabacterium sp. TaxID=1872578 RepID=UPI002BD64673|nr:GNAT family N-acetyltransferase [Aquabacterium sp.]HSW05011.1 GNAT family N-acetyltransferase [Aquabacterium sp.]